MEAGEFVVVCGQTGSGKSTLLELIKHDIAPYGNKTGKIFFDNKEIETYTSSDRSQTLGMVFQNPENQMVMDTPLNDIVFGMENLEMDNAQMQMRLAEMSTFLNLDHLLEKKSEDLSGGEKQLLNLASVLVLDPSILLLDEPTAQLDPILAERFVKQLKDLNENFGYTILIAEHRLEALVPLADRVLVMNNGELVFNGSPLELLEESRKDNYLAQFIPSVSLLALHFDAEEIPYSVNTGRQWLIKKRIAVENQEKNNKSEEFILQLKNINYQYDRTLPLILKDLNLQVNQGEWHTIMGANGSGKSTLLKILAGLERMQSGKIIWSGRKMSIKNAPKIAYLPQNPDLFFIEDTLIEEYLWIVNHHQIENGEELIAKGLKKFNLENLKNQHPYDLSGGQKQKAAILGALLTKPDLLLLDEPTKGLNPEIKFEIGEYLRGLDITIVMVSHDVEFTAEYSDSCSLLFNKTIVTQNDTYHFFKNNLFYTTVMSRVSRKLVEPQAITLKEAMEQWIFH